MSGGLTNLGNTCGINSLLQCICYVNKLRDYIISNECEDNTNIKYQLKDIYNKIWNDKASVNPVGCINIIYKIFPSLNRFEQHDISELWMLLSDKLAEEYGTPMSLPSNFVNVESKVYDTLYKNNNKKTSEWIESIQGVQISTIVCPNNNCNNCSWNPEIFTSLVLDIPNQDNSIFLSDLMKNYFKKEELNGWNCDKCKYNGNAYKENTLYSLPDILTVTLKRFAFVGDRYIKLRTSVVIEDEITITILNNKKNYRLKSIGIHHGSIMGGHYTAICYNSNNHCWYHIDDSSSVKVSVNDVLRLLQNNKDVYILFYESE